MGLSNYVMLSSLTAVLTTLIRINWGQEAMCNQLPSPWPSAALLSAVESSLGGDGKRWEEWASSSPPHHLHPGWDAEHCWAATSGFGGSVCCVGMGRLPLTVLASERSVRESIACLKLCLFVYHPFARHIGCVAAGKLLILVLAS